MFKQTVLIRIIVCFSCLFLLVIGCDKKSGEGEPAGKVISQKIPEAGKSIRQPVQPEAAVSPSQPAKPQAETTDSAEAATQTAVIQPEAPKYIPGPATGYDPTGKIDPFAALVRDEPVTAARDVEIAGEDATATDKKREKRVPQTPLEKIELNQLRLRAIILASSGNRALVEEASGKGYILTTGTYIGKNQGIVTKISKDSVVVEETIENIQGDSITQETELKLPKPPGEE
jgi:type IV pilus assembly protein PilP